MSDNVQLSSFPADKIEALTMLYLTQQDLKNISPEELVVKYNETYAIIKEKSREQRSKNVAVLK